MRRNISSGAEWEDMVGYSRAVRIGNQIEVAGTTAVVNGEVVGVNDPYLQTKCILRIIQKALEEAGASLEDVIRTRIFVVNMDHWQAVGKAHGEFFKEIKPAATMIGIKSLINKDLLVEIEAAAVLFKSGKK